MTPQHRVVAGGTCIAHTHLRKYIYVQINIQNQVHKEIFVYNRTFIDVKLQREFGGHQHGIAFFNMVMWTDERQQTYFIVSLIEA